MNKVAIATALGTLLVGDIAKPTTASEIR